MSRLSPNSQIDRAPQTQPDRWPILIVILALGLALRLTNLASKPLWADEILTAIFSLGRSMKEFPTSEWITLDRLAALFHLNPATTCSEIAQHLARESTHPPLFFCALHQGLIWLEPFNLPLAWKLRVLPALWGIGAIAAIYLLNRQAFSPNAGLMGAALAAVSPFGVYQSQEARHYTLPVLCITLSLIFLLEMQKARQSPLRRYGMALGWALTQTLGLYIHYFCAIAFLAQMLALAIGGWLGPKLKENPETKTPIENQKSKILYLLPFGLLPPLLYLPWLPVAIAHFSSPKSDWLPPPQHIIPLLQTLLAMILTIVAPPVESQPLAVTIPAIALTLLFLLWFLPQAYRGFRTLLAAPETREAALTLASFIAFVLLQFLAIVYLLGKDITIAPRYHFISYPALCALLAASIAALKTSPSPSLPPLVTEFRHFDFAPFDSAQDKQCALRSTTASRSTLSPPPLVTERSRSALSLLAVSLLSTLCVIFNLTFQKPYHPLPVARTFDKPPGSVAVVMGYNDNQQIAIGTSYALALKEIRGQSPARWLFLDSNRGYEPIWQFLSQQSIAPDNLWAIAPGLIEADYPPSLAIGSKVQCNRDPEQSYRVGIPFQLYRCPSS